MSIEVEDKNLDDFKSQIKGFEMYQALAHNKTNHILHVILSVVTLGFWLWGWCAVSADNCIKRNRILKEHKKPLETNTGLVLFVIFLVINVIVFWGRI